jgi:hypothetical protein
MRRHCSTRHVGRHWNRPWTRAGYPGMPTGRARHANIHGSMICGYYAHFDGLPPASIALLSTGSGAVWTRRTARAIRKQSSLLLAATTRRFLTGSRPRSGAYPERVSLEYSLACLLLAIDCPLDMTVPRCSRGASRPDMNQPQLVRCLIDACTSGKDCPSKSCCSAAAELPSRPHRSAARLACSRCCSLLGTC